MKRILLYLIVASVILSGCGAAAGSLGADNTQTPEQDNAAPMPELSGPDIGEIISIELSDSGVTAEGELVTADESAAVYVSNDIIYYEADQDFTYGEGTDADAHEPSEAEGHSVVHITKPGAYRLSGSLSAGQIAVDLGEDAENDTEAVVTLVLDGLDITCTVAPAVIFYNVYECGSKDEASASMTVDTSAAGANVIIADGSVNNVNGAYVARIYKPGSVVLSEDGREVEDAKKLHKYDAAFYSKMSMNIYGGTVGDGVLNIRAENEGLDSELHLTVNGGNINIVSGNDGINTNEDNISVTTINGGSVAIEVTGQTGEGDGIDSNGWLVINGGNVTAAACSDSGDAGIDSDMGTYLNGGTVTASGNMFDRVAGGSATYAVFTFAEKQPGGSVYTIKNADGTVVAEWSPKNDFTYLVVSGDGLVPGTYTLWQGETQLAFSSGGFAGGVGGMRPGGGTAQLPGNIQIPEGMQRPGGMEMTPPEGIQRPDGMEMTPPEGMQRPDGDWGGESVFSASEMSTEFIIVSGENFFSGVTKAA